MKGKISCLLFVFLILTMPVFLTESTAAPFYQGKTITVFVGMSPGGGYDRVARLLAKHLPKYIPGNPSIVVQNMPGASSMLATNYTYSVAKPNGLSIATFNRGLPFAQLTKVDGVKFDVTKFAWIGSAAEEATVLAIRSDLPYKNINDLRNAKGPIPLACSGPGVSDTQFLVLIKEFLGINIQLITYIAGAEQVLAIERKEVDGRAGSYSSLRPFIDRGLVRPILRGRTSAPGIENLPMAEDLATSSKGKTILTMLSSVDRIGRPFVAPPKTPPELMSILRGALAKMVKDPNLQEESRRSQLDISYVSAEECLKAMNYLFNQPQEIISEFGKYIKF